MRICLVEDDQDQVDLMCHWLKQAGHEVVVFEDGDVFCSHGRQESFDLIILDWMLPGMTGDQLLKWIRDHADWPVPVMFITAKDEEESIVYALSNGADDYMTKPVRQAELLARLSALSRRSQWGSNPTEEILELPPYEIKVEQRELSNNDSVIELTEREFDLAVFFFRNRGRILSRSHIMEVVWGQTADLATRTVDTHASRLRNKLGWNGESGWKLKSIYQHGYRLQSLVDDVAA